MNLRVGALVYLLLFSLGRLMAQFSEVRQNKLSPNITIPVKNFDGVSNFTNGALQPDTHGAVGPNYVMSISNLGFEILDKTGKIISGPTPDTTFFKALAGYGAPLRDGRLDYDPFGHRWIFIILYSPPAKPKGFFIAISSTDDPTGAWNMWAIPTNKLIDYPTLGFNKNWICVDNNRGSQLYVFDKQYMYSHTSQNAPSYKTIGNINGIWQSCITLDSAEDDLYLVQNTDSKQGKISIGKITGTGSAPVYNSLPAIITGYSWNSPASIKYPQLGSDNTLRSGGQDGMMNAIFINHAVWCTQSIGFFNPNRVGFQWWEIDPEQYSILQLERIQDSTGTYYYCSPSIAVDYQNNVLVGFSIFSKANYISSGYITHLASESKNAHDSIYTYMNGLGTYPKKSWGDYSNSMVDPADHSLWTVQAYANKNHDWTTRWANISLNKDEKKVSDSTRHLDVKIYPNPSQNKLMIIFGNHEEEYEVNAINENGTSIRQWKILPGELNYNLNISAFSDGIYFLQVKSKSGSKVLKFEVKR